MEIILRIRTSSKKYIKPPSKNHVDNFQEEINGNSEDGNLKTGVENSSHYDNISYPDYEDGYPTTEEILEYIYPKSWTWALIFFHFVVFVVGLVGNCLVCVAVYRNHTMRTVTNYFIVNLAVADFLVILFCLPPSVVWDVTSTWWFGTGMCKFVLYVQIQGVEILEIFLEKSIFVNIAKTAAKKNLKFGTQYELSILHALSHMVINYENQRRRYGYVINSFSKKIFAPLTLLKAF
ncbi:hypothetical protein NQ317_002896 [Molorchus minor]|uniref:G-protein coupled receptors family 1 profile domain-containing protein n=1 Tax=Molorchus minor TaxID=1323400 RepID=A0ABQ9JNF2_9CUCU|nr:hypothetical protein NQ317_002896 [Molorchus minor]